MTNLQGNPLPSPQANMFQKSMAALATTFEPIQEDDKVMNLAAVQPRMDYILENYNSNLKRVQIPAWKESVNYNENMLMLENLIQVPTPATTPLGNKIIDGLSEVLIEQVRNNLTGSQEEQGLNQELGQDGKNLNGIQGEQVLQQQSQQFEDSRLQESFLNVQDQPNGMVQNLVHPQEQMMMMQNENGLDHMSGMQQAEQYDQVLQQQFPRKVLNLQRTDSISSAYTRRLSGESACPNPATEFFSEVGSQSYSPPPILPGSHYPNLEYHHPGFLYSQMAMPYQHQQFNGFDVNLKNNPSSLENVRRKSFLNQQQVFGDNSMFQPSQFLNQPGSYPSNVYVSPQHSYAESPKRSGMMSTNSAIDIVSQHINYLHPGLEILDPNPPTPGSSSETRKSKKKRGFHCYFDNCKKTFETESRMEKHYLSHLPGGDKVKPFKCDVCPVSFSRSHDLKRHMYIHSSSKPFTCPRCFRGFSRRDALLRHENSFAIGKKVNCVPRAETRILHEGGYEMEQI